MIEIFSDINSGYLIAILILICCSSIFSCLETSITAASRAKIHQLKNRGNKKAIRIDKLLTQREKVVSAMLVGNNLVNILASTLAASIFIKLFGEAGLIYATASMTILVIIFAEIMPKTFAIKAPEKMLMLFFPIIWIVLRFFYPLTNYIQKFINRFVAIFFKKKISNSKTEELSELRSTIELKAIDGSIVKKDKDLLEGVLDLSDTDISEVMVYRKNIESLNIDLAKEEIIKNALNSPFSRIPLWKNERENIIAILNSKKLSNALYEINEKNLPLSDLNLDKIISKPIFVPTTNSLKTQLDEFKKNRSKIAIVVDEYGSLQGLITLQDVVEEIIGEVKELDDAQGAKIIKTRSGDYKIPAHILIRDINRFLNWDIAESDDAYNINAFIISHLGRIPQENESFTIQNYKFKVIKRDDYELKQLKVKKLPINQETSNQNE